MAEYHSGGTAMNQLILHAAPLDVTASVDECAASFAYDWQAYLNSDDCKLQLAIRGAVEKQQHYFWLYGCDQSTHTDDELIAIISGEHHV